jgi:cell division protein FtsB
MSVRAEISKRVRASATLIGCFLIIAYFSYHMVQGDRGLFAYLKLNHEIEKAEAVLTLTESEKQKLQNRVRLLDPKELDLDMLDERSRSVLGLAHPDEIVIYTPK